MILSRPSPSPAVKALPRAPGRIRNTGGDRQAGGDAQPAVPAHAPRARRDDRRPAARRTPHGRTERFAGADREVVDRWVDRLVITGIGGAGVLASAIVLLAAATARDHDVRVALWILGFAGLTCARCC